METKDNLIFSRNLINYSQYWSLFCCLLDVLRRKLEIVAAKFRWTVKEKDRQFDSHYRLALIQTLRLVIRSNKFRVNGSVMKSFYRLIFSMIY